MISRRANAHGSDDFVKRYTSRTAKSKAFTQEHRRTMADPRVVTGFKPQVKELIYQVVVDRSEGCHLWDLDGNEYVDILSGFGSSMFGYMPDFIKEACRKQIDAGIEIGRCIRWPRKYPAALRTDRSRARRRLQHRQ
jgi:glutamate-1-semialdehyde aminotransferase